MINIYCDESCHLPYDNSDCMVLGAITCDKSKVKGINADLRKLKIDYGLSSSFELKWSKVGKTKDEYYRRVIDYFFSNPFLNFRTVIAKNKNDLDHDAFSQTHDEWYYKMYYQLLSKLVDTSFTYKIYIDIKDTQGGSKVQKLKTILNNYLYAFYEEVVQGVQQIDSTESEIMQVADLLIGAISYVNRNLSSSKCKCELIDYICEKSQSTLKHKTSLYETKFNIFVWTPRRV